MARRDRLISALAVASLLLGGVTAAGAHPLAPALLELRLPAEGAPTVKFKLSRLQPRGSRVEPELPCEMAGTPTVREEGTGMVSEWQLDCPSEAVLGKTVGVRGLERSGTDALVRVELPNGTRLQRVLSGGDPPLEVPADAKPPSTWRVMRDYARLGIEHILSGLDHLLFVFGLVLLVTGRRLLLATVTSFTIGHSITLSLAALGFTRFPTALIEVGIAATLYFLALELVRRREGRRGGLGERPWAMAGGFGLLHGFGFAGALREIGLPPGEIPAALFSFNVGVEIGQVLFVVAVLLVGRAIAALPGAWVSPWRRLPEYAIGVLSVYWGLERALLALTV